jgi:hypothetical protein
MSLSTLYTELEAKGKHHVYENKIPLRKIMKNKGTGSPTCRFFDTA